MRKSLSSRSSHADAHPADQLRHGVQPQYAAILEDNPDALISLDAAGRITEWNLTAEDVFGYTRALALGRMAVGFILPPVAREPRLAELAHNLLTGKGRWIGRRTELTALRANGEGFPVELSLTRTPELNLAYTLCVRDITERKRAEEVLRRSEERFRLLVEGVEDHAIHLLDPHGRVLTWNAGIERMDGYRAKDIIGRRFDCLYTPEDIAKGVPAQALLTAQAEGRYRQEGWSVRKDGSRYWALVTLTALRTAGGELLGFCRIGRDCTKRKSEELVTKRLTAALERELHARTTQLAAANRRLRKVRGK
jgi:PAS domain S-box-containing protein